MVILDLQAKVLQYNDVTQNRLSKGQKAELDKTLSEHKAGKLKHYTIEQAKAIIGTVK